MSIRPLHALLYALCGLQLLPLVAHYSHLDGLYFRFLAVSPHLVGEDPSRGQGRRVDGSQRGSHDLENSDVRTAPETVDHRPGLIVLTGFLGSGKTSLLLEMLEHLRAHDQFVAIIQNEIGATGVDGYLVDGGESALTLDEGCVCCTLAGSLSNGIRRLTQQFQPERIILETSGLANPLNLLQEQDSWADLARLEMVVTVVDAVHGR